MYTPNNKASKYEAKTERPARRNGKIHYYPWKIQHSN